MKISVILPTYNREALLCQTISHVLRQEYPDFELIVLDQSPSHEETTEAFLEEHKHAIRYVRLEKPNVVAACNKGVEEAQGEILLLIDDDIMIPGRDLLARHAANYVDSRLGSVAGKILPAANPIERPYNPKSLDWKWGFLATTFDHDTRTETVSAQGCNMSFRKDAVIRSGGFDEHYDGNSFRWETDISYQLKKHGYYTIYDPTATVIHLYNSPGGCDNENLFGRSERSHDWYYYFFKNSFYFHLKNIGGTVFLPFIWKIYRGHVLNRTNLREGLRFQRLRTSVFLRGLSDALRLGYALRKGA